MGKMRIFVRSNTAFYTFKIRRSARPQIRILPPAVTSYIPVSCSGTHVKFGASSSSLATQFIVVERPIFTVISVPGTFDIMTTLTVSIMGVAYFYPAKYTVVINTTGPQGVS